MKWHHEVDPRWMVARESVLTATEVISLMPEYKRMQKKPGEISPGCAALWAEKHTTRAPEIWSVADAARGHITEPYAIKDYCVKSNKLYYHWDDVLVYRIEKTDEIIPLAFSPDAMPIPQPRRLVKVSNAALDNADSVLEVKCYGPSRHIKSVLTDEHEERYQLAVAMAVCDQIQEGTLLFYCPALTDYQVYDVTYTRDDLKEEIELVNNIASMYNASVHLMQEKLAMTNTYNASVTEEQIYQNMIEDELDVFSLHKGRIL